MAHGRMQWQRELAIVQGSVSWGFKGNAWQMEQFIKTGFIPGKQRQLPADVHNRVAKVQEWMKQHGRIPTAEEVEAIRNGTA